VAWDQAAGAALAKATIAANDEVMRTTRADGAKKFNIATIFITRRTPRGRI